MYVRKFLDTVEIRFAGILLPGNAVLQSTPPGPTCVVAGSKTCPSKIGVPLQAFVPIWRFVKYALRSPLRTASVSTVLAVVLPEFSRYCSQLKKKNVLS